MIIIPNMWQRHKTFKAKQYRKQNFKKKTEGIKQYEISLNKSIYSIMVADCLHRLVNDHVQQRRLLKAGAEGRHNDEHDHRDSDNIRDTYTSTDKSRHRPHPENIKIYRSTVYFNRIIFWLNFDITCEPFRWFIQRILPQRALCVFSSLNLYGRRTCST